MPEIDINLITMEDTITIRTVLDKTPCKYRSHFGSRYTSGRCARRSPFFFVFTGSSPTSPFRPPAWQRSGAAAPRTPSQKDGNSCRCNFRNGNRVDATLPCYFIDIYFMLRDLILIDTSHNWLFVFFLYPKISTYFNS